MKILHISSVPVTYLGGTEKFILMLSRRQAKKNKVTILQTNMYEEKKPYEKFSKIGKINVITCKNDSFLGGLGYSRGFKKELKKVWKDFDVIHIHGHGRFTSNYSLSFLRKKKPTIYSPQGFFHSKNNKLLKKTYDNLFSHRLGYASFCTALTKLDVPKLEKFGVKKEKIKILPGGINFKVFQIKPNLKKLREKYVGGGNNEKIILSVGRIHESKGLQEVVEAIKNLKLKFIIVGKDVGYKKMLEQKIKDLGVGKKVKFLGELEDDDLIEVYHLADVLVLCSEWEGFGIVVVEAMATGCPVIVSNKGALPSLVKNDFNGFVANNTKELEDKIELLIKDNKKRITLGKNAREFSKKFNWDEISKESLSLYEMAIKNDR